MQVEGASQNRLRLADLVPEYPDQFEERIQQKLSELLEFQKVASRIVEPIPARGEFFLHQKATQRFLREYDRLILIPRTGTGKTPSVQSFTEWARRQSLADPLFPLRQAIIIVPGKVVATEFRLQLICKSNPGEFENAPNVVKAPTDRARETALTNAIKGFYHIYHYGQFANEIYGKSDEDLRYLYSNTIFFLDEVHALNLDLRSYQSIVNGTYQPPPTRPTQLNKPYIYYQLHRLFRAVRGCKFIGATATPMYSAVDDIVSLTNLFAEPGREMPISPPGYGSYEELLLAGAAEARMRGGDITDLPTRILEPYFRGLYSYVREVDVEVTQIYRVNDGSDPDTIRVWNLQVDPAGRMVRIMRIANPPRSVTAVDPLTGASLEVEAYALPILNPRQREAYIRARSEDVRSKARGLEVQERQASSFIFPNGGYTSEDFNLFFDYSEDLKRYLLRDDERGGGLRTMYFHMVEMLETGSKMMIAAKHIQESPGVSVYFTRSLNNAEGAPVLGIALELLFGFELFTGDRSAFKPALGGKRLPPLCSVEAEKQLRDDFGARSRYAIISGRTTPEQVRHILEILNSPHNWAGQYVKGIIFTEAAEQGVSFSHVRRVGVITGQFRYSEFYQLVSRALRATSHEFVKARVANVTVDIFRYAAFLESNLADSADGQMILISTDIEFWTSRMLRVVKRCCWDCWIHKERNLRPTSQNFKQVCDFGTCEYKCVDPAPGRLISSNYNALYLDEIVPDIHARLVQIFRRRYSVRLEELYAALGLPPDQIDYALEKIIRERRTFTDNLGRESYLQVVGNLCYLTQTYPVERLVQSTPDDLIYTQSLVIEKSLALSNYLSPEQRLQGSSQIEAILGRNWNNDLIAIRDAIQTLNYTFKIELLERTLSTLMFRGGESFRRGLIDMWKLIYIDRRTVWDAFREAMSRVVLPSDFPNPLTYLNIAWLYSKGYWMVDFDRPATVDFIQKRAAALEVGKRGRKRRDPTDPIYFINLVEILPDHTIGNVVIVHRLYNLRVESNVKYNIVSRYRRVIRESPTKRTEASEAATELLLQRNRLRIIRYSESPMQWNDLRYIEWALYARLYNSLLDQEFAPFERPEVNFYAIVPHDGMLRIRDKTREERSRKSKMEQREGGRHDRRDVFRGKDCEQFQKQQLFLYAFMFRVPPPQFDTWEQVENAIRERAALHTNPNARNTLINQIVLSEAKSKKTVKIRESLERFSLTELLYAELWLESLGRSEGKGRICSRLRPAFDRAGLLYDALLYVLVQT